jgi:WS/DGAT/MGAT family acyltransferase
MSAIDTAWLRMDRRTNPMVIVSVTVLSEPCTLRDLKRMLQARFLRFERFRCIPATDPVGGTWSPDPQFELDAHVGEYTLPGTGTQADLEKLVGELAGTPLDPSRPLWRFELVRNYRGGSAMIMRIHHCYADGVALVRLFLGMTSLERDAPPLEDGFATGDEADARTLVWLRGLPAPAAALVGELLQGSQALVESALHRLMHPLEALDDAQRTAADVGGIAAELGTLLALPDDPVTPLSGSLGTRRQVAWIPPLPLVEVRTIGRALGCTINDVLLSVVAGALGRYLRSIGTDTTGLTIRATVPVNLRPMDEGFALGNRFGLVLLDLPVGLVHPLERLYAVRAGMQRLKGSRQPVATYAVLNALGHLPAALERAAIDTLSHKASLVISNVPGPRQRLYLCGRPISEMYFWVPQSGSIGVGISILTYTDVVLFGIVADRRLVPDPHAVIDGFADEFERLLLLTVYGAAHARGITHAGSAVVPATAAGSQTRIRTRTGARSGTPAGAANSNSNANATRAIARPAADARPPAKRRRKPAE